MLRVHTGNFEKAMSATPLANIAKARRLLGYNPEVSCSEGLRRTLDYYLANPISRAIRP
jgi:nucleoside-diphosphate-sugar epimerase